MTNLYPAINVIEEKLKVIEKNGYELLGSFVY